MTVLARHSVAKPCSSTPEAHSFDHRSFGALDAQRDTVRFLNYPLGLIKYMLEVLLVGRFRREVIGRALCDDAGLSRLRNAARWIR